MTTDKPLAGAARPLCGLFVMQSLVTLCIYSLPVIIPVAAIDLATSPESVGFYVALIYAASTISGLFSGELVEHFGAQRLFQGILLLSAVAVLALQFSSTWALVVMVLLLGAAAGPMNPTGSHVMAAVAPLQWRSMLFSIKQCATPAGGVLAGALLPPLIFVYGWRAVMLVIPVVALLLIFLAPLAKLGQANPVTTRVRFSFARTTRSLAQILADHKLRSITIVAFCLAMAQMALATYLVVYLWREVGLSEAEAGLVFSALHVAGIVSRLVLGALADRHFSASQLLASLCLLLALALASMSIFTPLWPMSLIYLVVVTAGASGNGWVGLYYVELARLAPADKVAQITGASQFFTYVGLLVGPLVFGLLLHLTASYQLTLLTFTAVITLAGGYLWLLNRYTH